MFFGVLRENKSISEAARADVVAAVERDPACRAYSQCLLYSKGFHAVQTHRIRWVKRRASAGTRWRVPVTQHESVPTDGLVLVPCQRHTRIRSHGLSHVPT